MEYRLKLQELGISLDRTGRQTCPQCSASRKNKTEKCLSVTYGEDAVLYNCHHCGWSGTVFYRSKNEQKKNWFKPEPPKTVKELAPIYKYFQKRGISQKTVDKYGISLNSNKEIVIPYFKNGELTNVKYRTNLDDGKKTFRQEKNTEKTLYGMDFVRDTDTLVWVEGEMDVLALAEQGICSVSVPQGAQEKELDCINNCFEFIKNFKEHIIAVDNDTAGDTLKETLLNRLGKENCKIVNWKQYKDANEALIAGENLKEFIDSAEDIAPDGIISFYDRFDEIYSYNFEKDSNYFRTGWYPFDELVKIRTGYMMIITGYPSRGKSTFVDNMLMNLSKRYNLKHLIASFESVLAGHYNALLEMYCEQSLFEITKKDKANIFGKPFEFIAEHFYRFDIDRQWTIDEIIQRTEMAVKKYGVNSLVIDPYNRLNNKISNSREDLYVGSILSKLSMLAKKLNILVIFVAHPKKPDGEKMPNMYSISGSSDWYNMADYGIIVHRERTVDGEKLSNESLIFVEKVKNYFLGNPSGGIVKLRYDFSRRVLDNKF